MAKGSFHQMLDVNAKSAPKGRPQLDHIRIHEAENGGHVVEHHFESAGAYHEPEQHVFGEDEGHKLIAHLKQHANIKVAGDEDGDKEKGESAAGAAY